MRRHTSLSLLTAALALSACDDDKGAGADDASGPSVSDTGPFDSDGDGWLARDDCDDSNSAVNPGEDEVCGNGTDEDCDGADPRCAPEGMVTLPDEAATFTGEAPIDNAGTAVAGAGDVNGDGLADLLIGAPRADSFTYGRAYLLLSPRTFGTLLSYADAILIGPDKDDTAGTSLDGAGDVNGDGYDDLIVSGPGGGDEDSPEGAAWVVQGPVTGTWSLGDEGAMLTGGTAYASAGNAVSSAGDTDADGLADLIIGVPYAGSGYEGEAWLVLGPASTTTQPETGYTLYGVTTAGYAGFTVSGGSDLDGDGYADVVLGAPIAGDSGEGAAYVVSGPIEGDLTMDDAVALTGPSETSYAGYAVGDGDFDGDGYGDVLVGTPLANVTYYEGATYVVSGPIHDDVVMTDADAELVGEDYYDYAGVSVSGAGDVNGDGTDDILVGSYDAGSSDEGWAYLVFGPVEGSIQLADADAMLAQVAEPSQAASSVAGVGDTNADGFSEVAVGDPKAGDNDEGAGYLVFGGMSR